MEANFDFQAEWKRFVEVVAPNAQEILDFVELYELLSAAGRCDRFGGPESLRVYKSWMAAGRPADVRRFIIDHANR